MTRTITAFALALGLFAALSTPGHAALSNSERQAPVAQAQTEANATQAALADEAPAAAVAPRTAQVAPAAAQPRKAAVRTVRPQLAAAPQFSPVARYGHRCH